MALPPVEVFAWQLDFLPQSGEPVTSSLSKVISGQRENVLTGEVNLSILPALSPLLLLAVF